MLKLQSNSSKNQYKRLYLGSSIYYLVVVVVVVLLKEILRNTWVGKDNAGRKRHEKIIAGRKGSCWW